MKAFEMTFLAFLEYCYQKRFFLARASFGINQKKRAQFHESVRNDVFGFFGILLPKTFLFCARFFWYQQPF